MHAVLQYSDLVQASSAVRMICKRSCPGSEPRAGSPEQLAASHPDSTWSIMATHGIEMQDTPDTYPSMALNTRYVGLSN